MKSINIYIRRSDLLELAQYDDKINNTLSSFRKFIKDVPKHISGASIALTKLGKAVSSCTSAVKALPYKSKRTLADKLCPYLINQKTYIQTNSPHFPIRLLAKAKCRIMMIAEKYFNKK